MAKDKKISPFSAFLLGVDGMVGSAIFFYPAVCIPRRETV